ncbi:TolC family protein [Halomonas denitrificans]|nr:TolC family protein [Halomonas denitrificans]
MTICIHAAARRVRACGTGLLVLLVLAAQPATSRAQSLSLAEATRRAVEANPELALYPLRDQALVAERQAAALRPGYSLGVEAENVLGTGPFQGVDGAELSVSLSSVLELGGQRDARTAVVDSRRSVVDAERRAEALDLAGEVARRFIDGLEVQARIDLAASAEELARSALEQVRVRVERGATPRAEALRAEAAMVRAGIEKSRWIAEFETARRAIASLWGADAPAFDRLEGDLFRFDPVPDFVTLRQRVAETPAIETFTARGRLLDAELALAEARADGQLEWEVGVRHDAGIGDSALVAGLRVPLFQKQRSRGRIRAARIEREAVEFQQAAERLSLDQQLFEAWRGYAMHVEVSKVLREDVLPLLTEALDETQAGYERGRYTYLDAVAARRELLEARRALIDAAAAALAQQVVIERLTGTSLNDPASIGAITNNPEE